MTTPDKQHRFERNISWAVLALLMVGCLVVLWPFLSALLWAAILAFTTWPVYQRVLAWARGRKSWAALIMTLAITCILLLPFVIVGATLADDVRRLTTAARHGIEAGPPNPPAWLGRVPLIGGTISNYWLNLTGNGERTLAALKSLIEPASDWFLRGGLAIGRGVIELTLSIFVVFFLYRDGADLGARVKGGAIRLGGERGERLLFLAGNTMRGVVFGILGTALVQGFIAGVGFIIADVPGAAALALLTFLLGILPMGPPLVWVPVTIWLFYHRGAGWGTFMLVWGLLVSSVDNVVKPWIIAKGASLPFILTFFGVIGGAIAFGFIGVFLGPTLLALGYAVMHEWLSPPPVVSPAVISSPPAVEPAEPPGHNAT